MDGAVARAKRTSTALSGGEGTCSTLLRDEHMVLRAEGKICTVLYIEVLRAEGTI